MSRASFTFRLASYMPSMVSATLHRPTSLQQSPGQWSMNVGRKFWSIAFLILSSPVQGGRPSQSISGFCSALAWHYGGSNTDCGSPYYNSQSPSKGAERTIVSQLYVVIHSNRRVDSVVSVISIWGAVYDLCSSCHWQPGNQSSLKSITLVWVRLSHRQICREDVPSLLHVVLDGILVCKLSLLALYGIWSSRRINP
jgi:hypothetical protein